MLLRAGAGRPQVRYKPRIDDAVREAHDSAEILRYLQAHQVFLVPLDEQGKWFRYHHLFSDLLNARPAEGLSHSRSGAHLRACRWFSAQGLLDEAIEQALRDADGSALVIHASPDDHMSQPIGGAGGRIACAVIR